MIVEKIILVKRKLSYKKVLIENYLVYMKNKKRLPQKVDDECIILIGTPEYGNMGDQLIAFSEYQLISDMFGKNRLLEITENDIRYRFKAVKKLIGKNLLVFQGGGNISDIWRDQEKLREKVLKKFVNNRIIIMPQTVYIVDLKKQKLILEKYNNSSILVCAREKYTYDMFKSIGKNNIILCPDIAFYLWDYCKKYRMNNKRNKIGVCLRKDEESVINIDSEVLEENIRNFGLEIEVFDTVINEHIVSKERKAKVDNILEYISNRELIFTDRLHAMIMAYLVGTPCVALANSNKKIQGCYEWIEETNNIIFAENIAEGLNSIKKIINKKNEEDFRHRDRFKEIFKIGMEK